uniref:Serpentine receptor class gamma n=1 Tax=Strongyloides venezuelensis TaxID=75913 RepID=A0A0K0FGX0_STRVS
MIGLGNIPLNARYEKFGLFGFFAPLLESENHIYYQIFYTIILFGIISIVTCIFNAMAVLTLKKHNKGGNKSKRELHYITYSIFIFITLFIVETFFVFHIIALQYKIKFFTNTNYFLYIVSFDLTSVGDFYFLIYLSSVLREALKTVFGCSTKFNNKVNIKILYLR